jgi:hypothetical protein
LDWGQGLFLGFAVFGVVLLAAFAAFLALVGFVVVALSQLGNVQFGPHPTRQELSVAATTSTIPSQGCASFATVERAADAAQHVLFETHHATWRRRMTDVLVVLDATVRNAEQYADGPMHAHLDAVRTTVEVNAWELAHDPQSDVFSGALNGYNDLEIADALLGATCDGVLAPEISIPNALRPTPTTTPR